MKWTVQQNELQLNNKIGKMRVKMFYLLKLLVGYKWTCNQFWSKQWNKPQTRDNTALLYQESL